MTSDNIEAIPSQSDLLENLGCIMEPKITSQVSIAIFIKAHTKLLFLLLPRSSWTKELDYGV